MTGWLLSGRHGDELLDGLGRARLRGRSSRGSTGMPPPRPDARTMKTAHAHSSDGGGALGPEGAGGRDAIRAGQPGRHDRMGGCRWGRSTTPDPACSASVAGRHQPHVVVVLGHSGGVVAPEPSDPPAARRESGDAVMKPATEPPASTCHRGWRVTGGRTAASRGPGRPPPEETVARSGLGDPAPSVRATALGRPRPPRLPSPTTRSAGAPWPILTPPCAGGPCELAATRPRVADRTPPRRP